MNVVFAKAEKIQFCSENDASKLCKSKFQYRSDQVTHMTVINFDKKNGP